MAKHKDIREFETGATRDTDNNKYDYEGFLSPLVIEAYGEYMHKHRKQPDGAMREADNWQLGIPMKQYMKSLWRHLFQLWKLHRNYTPVLGERGNPVNITDAICGIMFNAMGYLHEHLKAQRTYVPEMKMSKEPELGKMFKPAGGGQISRCII